MRLKLILLSGSCRRLRICRRATACEKLTGIAVPGLQITSAVSVPAGSFALPNAAPGAKPQVLPAFCRVSAVADPEVRFELWMPAQWNKKLLAVGNGGLAGIIAFNAMVKPLRRGYATSSTDTGHVEALNATERGRSDTMTGSSSFARSCRSRHGGSRQNHHADLLWRTAGACVLQRMLARRPRSPDRSAALPKRFRRHHRR